MDGLTAAQTGISAWPAGALWCRVDPKAVPGAFRRV